MAGNCGRFYINPRCLVRFLDPEIVVVACTSPFRLSVLGWFGDSHTESCHRRNTVHVHLILRHSLEGSPMYKIGTYYKRTY